MALADAALRIATEHSRHFGDAIVAYLFAGARILCGNERAVIHPECRIIALIRKLDIVFPQDIAVRLHLDRLVIDNHAVKIEQDCLDHFETS